jgi:RNA polymerase sigma-70 factor (ECF subfamily)
MVTALLVPNSYALDWLGFFAIARQGPADDGRVHRVKQAVAGPGGSPSDAALVVAAQGGEKWAFEALFRRHASLAFGLAYRLLPRDSEVEDIVQDVFSIAFERLASLHNPQAFAAWLGSIVVNTVSKRLRRRRLLERLGLRSLEPIDLDQIVSPVAPVEIAAELNAVYSRLQQLPTEERVALVLRRVEGMEIAQIAEHMGISASTVKRRLTAAEVRLGRARPR